MRDYEKIRSVIIRGGTSKGVFILKTIYPMIQKLGTE